MEEKNTHNNEENKTTWCDKIQSTVRKAINNFGTMLVKLTEEEPEQDYQKPEAGCPAYHEWHNQQADGINPVGHNDDLDKIDDDGNADEHPDEFQADKENAPVQADASGMNYKLVRNTAKLVAEYDRIAEESTDKAVKLLYQDAATKLIENLILSGCTGINPQEDEPFDFNRHVAQPFSLAIN